MDWKWKVLIGIEGAFTILACLYGTIQGHRIKLFNEEHGLGRMSWWWHAPDLPRLLTFIARTRNREAKREAVKLLLDFSIAVIVFVLSALLFFGTLDRLT